MPQCPIAGDATGWNLVDLLEIYCLDKLGDWSHHADPRLDDQESSETEQGQDRGHLAGNGQRL